MESRRTFCFSSYFSFLQTSKTSLRSVRLNSPPELGFKKTLHLFIIFFIFATIQNFQKIMLHSTSELGSGRTFSLLTMIFILQTCQASIKRYINFQHESVDKNPPLGFKIIKKIRFKQFNPSILGLLRSTNTTESTSSSFKY